MLLLYVISQNFLIIIILVCIYHFPSIIILYAAGHMSRFVLCANCLSFSGECIFQYNHLRFKKNYQKNLVFRGGVKLADLSAIPFVQITVSWLFLISNRVICLSLLDILFVALSIIY